MLPKSLVSENDLRTFLCCPQLYHFSGSLVYPDTVALLKLTTEKAISETLRNNKLDPELHYVSCLLKASKELNLSNIYPTAQLQDIHTLVAKLFGELFVSFKANLYVPVFGPAPWRVKVSKSTIELAVSGILRESTKQTLHAIDFSPYQNMLGLRNDPVPYLKNTTLAQFISPWHKDKRAQCILHLFSISNKGKLLYMQVDNRQTTQALSRVANLVTALESGYSYPNLPCDRACAFKTQCNLGDS